FGALLEIILAIANIATAVVLYPILKRQSQSISLGYVASRTLESTVIVIVIGIVSVLSVVTLRQDVGGAGAADGASLVLAGWSSSMTGRSCSAPPSVPASEPGCCSAI